MVDWPSTWQTWLSTINDGPAHASLPSNFLPAQLWLEPMLPLALAPAVTTDVLSKIPAAIDPLHRWLWFLDKRGGLHLGRLGLGNIKGSCITLNHVAFLCRGGEAAATVAAPPCGRQPPVQVILVPPPTSRQRTLSHLSGAVVSASLPQKCAAAANMPLNPAAFVDSSYPQTRSSLQ